ncbi:MAG TPA: DUF2182 domain-containing protein [Thermomicrobiaceae bacterium]|nr:DUF2182 domain-containing protein [Thermomicrobiaceae bacterium]
MSSRSLTARRSLAPATALLAVAGLAWLGTIIWARGMGIMPGTMGLNLAVFVVMWTLMMAAMMLPSAVPMVLLYARTLPAGAGSRLALFGLSYLLIWALAGVPAFALAWLAGRVAPAHPTLSVAAAALIFAGCGVYQLSGLQRRCLTHCRSPLAQLLHYGNYRGRLRDLRAGAHHGAYCLGCCAALMVLLIAFGVMNLTAMVVLAVVIAIEKQWSHGAGFARLVGIASLALAVLVIIYPGLAPGLHAGMDMGMGM